MLKKAALALFGLIFAVGLAMPTKADAAVVVGVAPRPYVYVGPGYYGPHFAYRPYYAPYRVYVGPGYYRHYGYRYYGPRYGWHR